MNYIKIYISAFLIALSLQAAAKWYTNAAYNFKIDVPHSWSANYYTEGTDQVYDFLSPDEQIAIQIRAFESEPGFTTDLIMSVVEEGILGQGATKLTASDDEVNGLHGKKAAYKNTYDGQEVGIVIFTALAQQFGYAFIVVVPTDVFEEKTAEADAMLNTFTLLNRNNHARSRPPQKLKQPHSSSQSGSLGGNAGSHKTNLNTGQTHQTDMAGNINPGNNHVAFTMSGAALNRPSGKADPGYQWFTEVRHMHFQVPANYKPYNYGHWEALHSWSGGAGTITLRVYRGGKKQGFENLTNAITTMNAMDNMNYLGVRNVRGYMMHMFQSESEERQQNQDYKRIDHVLLTVNEDVAWFSFVGDKSNYSNMEKEAKHVLNTLHKGIYQ